MAGRAATPVAWALLGACLAAAAEPAPAVSPVEQVAVTRVQAWLDSWTLLEGRFEQVLVSATLPSARLESGRFFVRRPDRMRWDYREPQRKLAVSDGVTTWLYLPEDRQVMRGRVADLRQDTALSMLLSGPRRIEEIFTVLEARLDGDGITLGLEPRSASESIEAVRLEASADGHVQALTVTDPTGNEVTWRLADLVVPARLEDKLFTFEPPAGVEIQEIGLPGPP
jgi:outer membrane lipoprotein carrier protein